MANKLIYKEIAETKKFIDAFEDICRRYPLSKGHSITLKKLKRKLADLSSQLYKKK